MELGRKIADLRNNINMSQQTLAELLFVSRDLVSKWENGSKRPDYTTIKKLAAIFRVSADEIISKNDVAFKELAECVDDGTELTEEELTGLLNGFLAGLTEKEADIFMKRYYFCCQPLRSRRNTGSGIITSAAFCPRPGRNSNDTSGRR